MRVLVFGSTGLVGASIVLRLLEDRDCEVVALTRTDADCTVYTEVLAALEHYTPDVVVCAAGRVGGILDNQLHPWQFAHVNTSIAVNVVGACTAALIPKLIYLGSSCIYPRLAPQPIPELALLASELESTNSAYAVSKIAGINLCVAAHQELGLDYRSVMPTNLYGANDNWDLQWAHVLPALLHRIHLAKLGAAPSVEVWGTGVARREFMLVDDCADFIHHLIYTVDSDTFWSATPGWVNCGTGVDCSIQELVELICSTVGYTGNIVWDHTKPDGTPRKQLDVTLATQLGWRSRTLLADGLAQTYQDFLQQQS